MSSARRCLPFGAELLASGLTRFRLWAPDAARVECLREGERPLDMAATGEGWHEVVATAPPGTRYRYRIDGDFRVPDPAARAQAGDARGASVVVDPGAYDWQLPQWQGRHWEEAILYELHVGLYGGFRGVLAQLPDLARLGITAIELMPVAQFAGQRNWGYDGVLPFAPAAAYGTPEDLKALVDGAHALGLMVLLDVVYNHFGPEGNHLPRYASAFFDPARQTPWGAAIDFSRVEVRQFFLENALYWLQEYRFDGLRIDAAHAIGDPGFLRELAARVGRADENGCLRHLVLENEENDATLLADACVAQWNDDAHHVLHVLLTGETQGYYADYAQAPARALARWLGEGFVYQGEPMGYRDGRPRGTPSTGLPPTAFVNCLQNHDQVGNRALGERLAVLAPPERLLAAEALLLLVPQIPMLFMGEDWGTQVPFLYFTDFGGELGAAVREGRKREFARFTAFGADGVPDPDSPATFEASRPDFDVRDTPWRAAIGKLLALRHAQVIPRLRGAQPLGAEVLGEAAVHAGWRMGDGAILRIAVNLGDRPVPLAIPATPFYCSRDGAPAGILPADCCMAWLGAEGT